MATGVAGGGLVDEQQLEMQLERQMGGCMAGFFQMFDRGQMLSARRLHSTRRLTSSLGSASPSERSDASSLSVLKENHPSPPSEPPSSPEMQPQEDAPSRPSLPLPLPVFDFKDGMRTSWKIREAPRLSLDSRAVLDGKGKLRPRDIRTVVPANQSNASESAESEKQRPSPSVVARLMGLEALPGKGGAPAEANHSQLRRSASESRVPRDPSYYRFVDTSSFEKPPPPEPIPISAEEFFRRVNVANFRVTKDAKKSDLPSPRTPVHPPLQRKSFFDAQDFFPEPKRSGSLYDEIEKRLRKRGIDEPARDLETLKHILEALQLKGLLHSNHSGQTAGRRNIIYDDRRISGESPIVLMRPAPRPPRRPLSESPPPLSRSVVCRQSPNASSDCSSPVRRDSRSVGPTNEKRNRTLRSPENPSSPARRGAVNAPELRKSPQAQPRNNAVSSPKASPRRVSPLAAAVRSPRIRKQPTHEASPTEDDTSTTISESSHSASSQVDFERSRAEEYRSGRSLLERCDKLMDSIAAFTAGDKLAAAGEHQPSPVSVLDSSNYLRGEESSPSPVTKRSIDFKEHHDHLVGDWEEDLWNQSTPTTGSNNGEESIEADDEDGVCDVDYAYVSEVVRLSRRNTDTPSGDVYVALEKRRHACDTSKASQLHRRLIFDAVVEIFNRKRQVSPWEAFSLARSLLFDAAGDGGPLLRHVWGELRRIREQVDADDLNDVTCGAIRKDMEGGSRIDGGWGAHPAAVEMSDAVLHIERQIFKDLIADAIRDLADASAVKSSRPSVSRRKLLF